MAPAARPTLNDDFLWLLRRAAAPLKSAPWWVQVTLVYLAARVVSYAILLATAGHDGVTPWGSGPAGYLDFINRWDGEWYQRIYSGGYPHSIPRDGNGNAQTNAWAFYPLFPFLVRGLHAATTLDWVVLAPAVATLAGLAATLMIYVLFARFVPGATALWGAAFFATFPISPVLQIPYAESLSTFLLAAALYLLITSRYGWAIPVVILLCLSRPAGVPFAGVVAVHILLRWRRRRRTPFPPREAAGSLVLLLVSGAMALAWMFIAWAATGERSAYTDTETSWRGGTLVLFKPWFDAGVQLVGPLWGPLLPVLLAALAALALNSHAVRLIGTELRVWCALYLLYLLAVLDPQTSTFRMLLPLFPLALAAAAGSNSRAYRWTVVVMFTALQIVWVVWLWRWTPLPGGGDYPP
ncbi:hypothetical protein [Specibacter sp. RAF43]|uniref:hypothetical protein n=1 Tax=Specibacter sp. RAF43 TaxID=3233057 RepID=UPI003F9C1C26